MGINHVALADASPGTSIGLALRKSCFINIRQLNFTPLRLGD